jgi:dTDP-4-dehydrorhamnose 3,5-epimerase
VDLRKSSPTFGQWVGEFLNAATKKQMLIPEGFAHGFVMMSDMADVLYKTTDYYSPEHERCIRWDDSDLAIKWPVHGKAALSRKDAQGKLLAEAELFS